jgi:uncharacterized protein (DUF2236 family)
MNGDDGCFGDGSMMWRINRERVVLLAGPAAAVMQVAHPQVARGVAAHSRFREDAGGRLIRTLDAVYAVAFGTREEVAEVRKRVAAAHAKVRGDTYSAFDPDAQLWVMATLIQGSVSMFRRFIGELSAEQLDDFLRENRVFGEVFGIPPARLPATWSSFESYWQEMTTGDLLGSDPLCAEVARGVVRPSGPWWLKTASPVIEELAAGLIGDALVDRLGLRRRAAGVIWPCLDTMFPVLAPLTPSCLRFCGAYRRALTRDPRRTWLKHRDRSLR